MAQLQKEGKVRWIGVSNFNVEEMRRAQAIAPITSLQPPYSLVRREVEQEILPYCRSERPGRDRLFADGLGLVDWRNDTRTSRKSSGQRLAESRRRVPRSETVENLALVERLREVGRTPVRRPPGTSRDRLGASKSCRDRRDRRRSQRQASRRKRVVLPSFRLTTKEIAEIEGRNTNRSRS